MKKIVALIPCYNEEECLQSLYTEVTDVLSKIDGYKFEILLINDGSKDRTLEIMRELHNKDKNVSYINLSRNYGKEIAMAAGFDYCDADAVVILDADLQDPPRLIPEMLKYFEEGYDDIYGKRRSRDGESLIKKSTSNLFYKILSKLTKVPIQKNTGDFRLLSRRAVEALKQYRECRRYTKGFFSLIGFRKKEVLFDRSPRVAGKTKWNYLSLTNLAIEGITSFTSLPLRLTSVCGFSVAIIGFIYLTYIVVKTILFGDPVSGYPTLISIILILGGIQLLSLGIIGEYIGRIFDETKRRPLYFIDEYNGENKI